MARRVELLPRASRELAAVPDSTRRRIIARLEMLREFPELGAPMRDAFEDYRSLLVANRRYRVVYRLLGDDRVEVAYIRHSARQLGVRVVRSKDE